MRWHCRRGAAALAGALALAGAAVLPVQPAAAATSCPSGQACVIVTINGDSPRVITYAALDGARDPGPSPVPYQVRARPGGPTQSEPQPNYVTSVRTVLQTLVGVDPDQVGSVAVQADGLPNTTVLAGDDLSAPGSARFPFADGLMPAFFGNGSGNPHTVSFIRPLRPGSSDVNVKDSFQSLNNGAIQMRVHTSGEVLHPVIAASATKTEVDKPVSFSATLTQPADSPLHYTWDFGDGATSTDPAPSHAWQQGGSTYQVTLTVTADSGAAGTATTAIQVGKKPGPGDEPGPGSGHYDNPDAQQYGPSDSSGTHDGEAGDHDAAPQEGTPDGTGGHKPKPHQRKHDRQQPASGTEVQGILLDDAVTVTPTSSQVERKATAQPAHSVPPVEHRMLVLGAGSLVALLGLGALGQTRGVRRRLPVPIWRRW
ncbi:MAG: PKD domain-containing protein [Nocardioides sp.]|uniref:PKD domain-containing protein n=1 Tax=Nocardioides sp. TaxID=35761 RepID=UPI0039E21772